MATSVTEKYNSTFVIKGELARLTALGRRTTHAHIDSLLDELFDAMMRETDADVSGIVTQ